MSRRVLVQGYRDTFGPLPSKPSALRAMDEPHHVWDIHASILYLLGLDHLRVTYQHNGRVERPTVTGENLIPKLWT